MRYVLAFLLLVGLLALLAVLNLRVGSVRQPDGAIVWRLRAPRMLAAAVLGGGLSLSGFLLQTFFANPIAGPFVLGISSGAKLAVSLMMIFLLKRGLVSSSAAMIGAAFLGAMLSMGFILLISRRVRRMSLLVVCGVMLGYICSAITDFVVTFAEDSNIVNLHNWSMGSFSGIYWDSVGVIALVTGAALLLAFLLSKPIGAYQRQRCPPAGGGLCPEYGGGYPAVPGGADSAVQPAVRLRDGLRRAGVLCGHRRAPSGKAAVRNSQTPSDDPGLFSGRRGLLPAERPHRPHGLCPQRDEHQLGDRPAGRAGGHRHAGREEAGA